MCRVCPDWLALLQKVGRDVLVHIEFCPLLTLPIWDKSFQAKVTAVQIEPIRDGLIFVL